MTDDPRASARQWLAEILWHDGLMHVMSPEDLADAILSAPGVEIEVGAGHDACEHWGIKFDNGWFASHSGWWPVFRVVIRLPAQPIEEGT